MELVDCNLCGSSDFKFVYKMPDLKYYPDEWFDIVECCNCGLGFVNPRPDKEEIYRYYPIDFFSYFDTEFNYRRYVSEAKVLLNLGVSNKKLLDVGCANGDFPRVMKKLGWIVEGLEISEQAKAIDDFIVYRCPFPDLDVGNKKYGVVTMWAVLEHTHDPKAHFIKANSILKLGGYFVFLVNNFNSIASRRLYAEDVPRHLYFFTEDNIRRYLESSGFRLLDLKYGNDIYRGAPDSWLNYFKIKYIHRRDFNIADKRKNRTRFCQEKGLQPGKLSSILKYMFEEPISFCDALLLPLIERLEIFFKRYGVVTYIAKKI